jgi:anti-sigma factor RsiW
MKHLSDDLLNEYLDKALSPDLHAEASAHLAACPDCAARLADLRTMFADLDALPDLPLEVDFAPAIVARLAQNVPLPRPIRWLTISQAFGALLAVILAWPLAETMLSTLKLPALSEILTGLAASWLHISADLYLPTLTFEMPSIPLDLPSTTLTLTVLGVSLLWLAANGLLLIPRSRRTS